MADEHYNLKWNNHQPNFISVFQSLLQLEELVDVTLSVEGKHIKAHKIILSACSPYFKMLFKVAPCKHPIVILDDIKYKDLRTIVDFMYLGEINVGDDQLADILEVAESLQVLGLFDPSKKTSKSTNHKGCENSSKKRSRQLKTVEVDDSQSGSGTTPLSELDECRSAESSMDVMVNPTDWLEINDQSCNRESVDTVQCSSLELGVGGIINNSNCEKLNYVNPYGQLDHNLSPLFKNIGSSSNVVRRRNSKVQDSENFSLALEAVRSGSLGFCKAAKIYGLNNRTLWLEYKKRGYPTIRPPVNARHKNALSSSTS